MIDASMIGGALSSMKTAYDLAKGMAEFSKEVEVKLKAHELLMAMADLQGKLLDTQQALGAMQSELRAAKEELNKRAAFDRYELNEPYKGTLLYRLKPNMRQENEPAHYICPNCKDVLAKVSVMQLDGQFARCQNKDCGRIYDLAPPPSINHSHNPYVV